MMVEKITKFSEIIKENSRTIGIWGLLFIALYLVGLIIPQGFDWEMYFSKGRIHPIWTPWTTIVIRFINWPFVVAITLFSIIFRAFSYNKSPIPIALAILSLPTIWVLYMGNLDGLVLAGLILLPWGIPLSLMKPQLSAFALLAKRNSFIAGIVWFLISLIIWGLWPVNFLMVLTPEWKAGWVQDITLFPWGLFIALPLLWLSRGDEDLLMAAGSFATPHLFPYHFILLMPAIARMNKFWMIICWAISWTPLSANWFGPIGWHMGNVLSGCIWIGISLSKRNQKIEKLSSMKEI